MYELLRAGALGNTFRMWPSVTAAAADGYDGPFGLRFVGWIGAPAFGMKPMSAAEVHRAINEAPPEWRDKAMPCEAVPNHRITMNAETQLTSHGLYLRYGLGPGHMKDSLARSEHATGVTAMNMILKHGGVDLYYHLCDLMARYDGPLPSESAVVEFSTFSVPVGPEQKYWVVWEVRSTY